MTLSQRNNLPMTATTNQKPCSLEECKNDFNIE